MLATTVFVVSEITLTVSEPQFATKTSPLPASYAAPSESLTEGKLVSEMVAATVLVTSPRVWPISGAGESPVVQELGRPGAGWTGPADCVRKLVEMPPPAPRLTKLKQTRTTATSASLPSQLPHSPLTRRGIVNNC